MEAPRPAQNLARARAHPGPVLLSCVVIFPAHTSSAVLVFFASWVMMLIGRVRIRELVKLLGLAFAA